MTKNVINLEKVFIINWNNLSSNEDGLKVIHLLLY